MDDSPGPVRYASSQRFSIAWQEFGTGSTDLCVIWGNPNNIEALWEWPTLATFLRGLGRLGRVVHLDQRGCGLSDRVGATGLPTLPEKVHDVLAVMDAAEMSTVTLIGESEGAASAVRLAASHPERVERLILLAPTLRSHVPADLRDDALDFVESHWGTPAFVELLFSTQASDPRFVEWWSRFLRLSASPGEARAMLEADLRVDEMGTLAEVDAPTLVVSHDQDPFAPAEEVRGVAASLPNASLVLIPGQARTFGSGPGDDEALAAIAAFLEQEPPSASETDRRRHAILFTDIVESTTQLARVGDQAWRAVLDRHDRIMSELITESGGNWMESTGDGVVATLPSAGAALAVVLAALPRVAELGVEIRAGVHVGDVTLRGGGIAGIDVHIASRIANEASANQILVSEPAASEVGDTMVLAPNGDHHLKGVSGTWQLWEVRVLDQARPDD